MKAVEKALILREGTRWRYRQPESLMRRRLREPLRILALVERSELPQASKREARRQYIVASCAAFESFWREFVRVNVDRHPIRRARLRQLKGLSFTIGDIQDVLGRKLTLGELVSCSYSFQGPEALDSSLSEILRCQAFSDFAQTRFSVREVPYKRRPKRRPLLDTEVTGRDILKRTVPLIQRAYTIRHDTFHNTGARHRLSARDAMVVGNAAGELCLFLGMHLDGKFDSFWTHQSPTPQPSTHLEPTPTSALVRRRG